MIGTAPAGCQGRRCEGEALVDRIAPAGKATGPPAAPPGSGSLGGPRGAAVRAAPPARTASNLGRCWERAAHRGAEGIVLRLAGRVQPLDLHFDLDGINGT